MTDQPDQPEAPPSTDVVVLPRDPLNLSHLSLYDINALASNAARSRYFADAPIGAAAAVKIVWGQELGIPPMASLSGIHMVKGKPGMHYATIGALLKKHGWRFDPVEWDDEHCVIDWYEPNPDRALIWVPPTGFTIEDVEKLPPRHTLVGQSSWSLEEARRAGVVKDQSPWKTYPKVMLYARALSIGAKIFAPEIFSGAVYTDDELRETSFDVEAVAEEIKSVVEVPDETPSVSAKPAEATVELASPAQRGALWIAARKHGHDRATFERLIKTLFDIPSLDRLPASLVGAAMEAVETPPPAPPAGDDQHPEPAGQAGDAESPPLPASPAEGPCLAAGCEFKAAEDGLCFLHFEQRRAMGSIAFESEQKKIRETA